MSIEALQQVLNALLREWGVIFTVTHRGTFVDYDVDSRGALSIPVRQRFRLFLRAASDAELATLVTEATANSRHPVAIAPFGPNSDRREIQVIGPTEFEGLCLESGVVETSDAGFCVDRDAYKELSDHSDPRVALLNGLLWLRSLSRDRVPPPLRWTGIPAHELFERCFFLSMLTTFGCGGVSWGTRERGRPVPDGRLSFRGSRATVLYDCKAARDGYDMAYRDLTGFVDYLRHPLEQGWTRGRRGTTYFLIVSSEFTGAHPERTYRSRKSQLHKKAKGAQLVWMTAPALATFGLAIERANVSVAHRAKIRWTRLLDAGYVQTSHFDDELKMLSRFGYRFNQ